ncbi:transcription elongation factor Elf1 [Paenibacillus sp. V4I3]|uniref:TnsD family Tn7-like transposition protein n=1 Tax=Paenibacillus sp. V4I3 TaxID=3042305 RepID=UPI00277EB6F1|nr:TnsD family Tn7-like transposition protein [Paenibacillus sp. V4I3]MDQ0878246.1 transcription elongation factor Elf1 [Paenibacillus sp. V4I3]
MYFDLIYMGLFGTRSGLNAVFTRNFGYMLNRATMRHLITNRGVRMKIDFHLPMYDDEDFRSILYRIHMLKNRSFSIVVTYNELFGKKLKKRNYKCPFMISTLINALPKNSITEDEFLERHSYLPISFTFLKETRKVQVKEQVCNTVLTGFHSNNLSYFLTDTIRYCPVCCKQDYETFGECYIHRLHQFKHLDVCYDHKCKLIDSCQSCGESLVFNHQSIYKPNCNRCGQSISIDIASIDFSSIIFKYLENIRFLMKNGFNINTESLKNRYIAFAFGAGFIERAGYFNNKKLFQVVVQYMSSLKGFTVSLKEDHFSKQYLQLTLMGDLYIHSALMDIIGGSAEDLFASEHPLVAEPIPFGIGPWKCLNEYCGNWSITKCKRTYSYNDKKYRGCFQCPDCNYIYSKLEFSEKVNVLSTGAKWKQCTLQDSTKSISFSKVRYYRYSQAISGEKQIRKKKYDLDWFKRLIQHYNTTKSYYKTSKYMDVAYTTVKKYVLLFLNNNNSYDIFTTLRICTEYEISKIENTKEVIVSCLNEKNYSRSELLNIVGEKAWMSLLETDPNWCDEHLPERNYSKVNWSELDLKFINILVPIVQSVLTSPPRQKIRLGTFVSKLKKNEEMMIRQNENNLPLTYKLIKDNIETNEQFQRRN